MDYMQVRIHLMLRNSLMVVFLHSRSNGETESAGDTLRGIHIPGHWVGEWSGGSGEDDK